MTLKKSTDSGNHWQVDTLIYAGESTYSVVVPLDAARIGVVYERGEWDAVTVGARTITFATVAPSR
eukprot:SAG22_NODE_691_length_7888_cov_6.740788_3_plen_66_part_00